MRAHATAERLAPACTPHWVPMPTPIGLAQL
jgi:hypothetical protein